MLRFLNIQNFAIIKQSELNFCNQLNVLSGETGSGKSIIMKAIKFVLGSRSDKTVIRDGAPYAKVEATFFDVDNNSLEFLRKLDIDFDDEIIISRKIYIDGKNEIKINGCSVSLGMLNSITQSMVDIYNQQDHFSLLNIKKHLQILDEFCAGQSNAIKNNLKLLIEEVKEIDEKLKTNFVDEDQKNKELDLLHFQIQEIEQNIFSEKEYEDLQNKKKYLNNFKKILENLNFAYSILESGYKNNSLSSALRDIQCNISIIEQYDESFKDISERLNNAKYEIEDIKDFVSNKITGLDVSDEKIDEIEDRLQKIKNLQRKYGQNLPDITKSLDEYKQRLYYLENNQKILEDLSNSKENLLSKILIEYEKLSKIRHQTAKTFEESIMVELTDLGMKDCSFKVNFIKNEQILYSINGNEEVEFVFSANKGQEMKSLSKIISGGELSRFMLAYKNVSNQSDKKDLIIFDEVDAGISGMIGQKIAYKMNKISNFCQVIAVSHLPQIISMADKNLHVYKDVIDDQTMSFVDELQGEKLVKEIARVCGNGEISQNSLGLAKDLLDSSKSYKDKN